MRIHDIGAQEQPEGERRANRGSDQEDDGDDFCPGANTIV
jgi:hypothetical protein